MIKLRTFTGTAISDMKLLALPLLKKKLDKVVVHVGNDSTPHFTPDEMFKNVEEIPLLTQKMVPSVYFTKAYSDNNNKKSISLKGCCLHTNRAGSISLAKNLISGIGQF